MKKQNDNTKSKNQKTSFIELIITGYQINNMKDKTKNLTFGEISYRRLAKGWMNHQKIIFVPAIVEQDSKSLQVTEIYIGKKM